MFFQTEIGLRVFGSKKRGAGESAVFVGLISSRYSGFASNVKTIGFSCSAMVKGAFVGYSFPFVQKIWKS